jgi:hypothetical protein
MILVVEEERSSRRDNVSHNMEMIVGKFSGVSFTMFWATGTSVSAATDRTSSSSSFKLVIVTLLSLYRGHTLALTRAGVLVTAMSLDQLELIIYTS